MSNTQSTQIKVTLPQELYLLVKANADRLGLSLATYIRHITINDSWDKNLPIDKMTAKQERVLEKALEDYKNGNTTRVDNIESYFTNLLKK